MSSQLVDIVLNGTIDNLRLFLQNEPQRQSLVQQVDPSLGRTALHVAVYNGKEEASQLLILANANVNTPFTQYTNYTALHIAAKKNFTGILNFLLANGADVNVVGSDGRTPLHLAIQFSTVEAVQNLVNKGANINFVSAQNATSPLMLAQEHAANPGVAPKLQILLNANNSAAPAGQVNPAPAAAAQNGGKPENLADKDSVEEEADSEENESEENDEEDEKREAKEKEDFYKSFLGDQKCGVCNAAVTFLTYEAHLTSGTCCGIFTKAKATTKATNDDSCSEQFFSSGRNQITLGTQNNFYEVVTKIDGDTTGDFPPILLMVHPSSSKQGWQFWCTIKTESAITSTEDETLTKFCNKFRCKLQLKHQVFLLFLQKLFVSFYLLFYIKGCSLCC